VREREADDRRAVRDLTWGRLEAVTVTATSLGWAAALGEDDRMRDIDLFGQALRLVAPWRVVDCDFGGQQRRLQLRIDFEKGARFACPQCGAEGCEVKDTATKTWRHLDFFQHEAFLTARVPRVRCAEHGIHLVAVAWARPGSGFTLLFEAFVMALAKQMPHGRRRFSDPHS